MAICTLLEIVNRMSPTLMIHLHKKYIIIIICFIIYFIVVQVNVLVGVRREVHDVCRASQCDFRSAFFAATEAVGPRSWQSRGPMKIYLMLVVCSGHFFREKIIAIPLPHGVILCSREEMIIVSICNRPVNGKKRSANKGKIRVIAERVSLTAFILLYLQE